MFRRALYFARIGRVPALLNFSINLVIGFVLFGRRDLVPWTDAGSAGADLLVGGCIVATVTAWAASPRIARDAKAGLVAGRPASSPWRFVPKGRVIGSVIIGVVLALGLLLAIVPPGEAAFPQGIAGTSAAFFKGVTSLVAGHLAIVLHGNRVLVGAPDRTAELAAMAPAKGVKLEPIALACLAGTSREHGASVAPTWRLTLVGDVRDEDIRSSFETMSRVALVCRSVVRPVDGLPDYAKNFVWTDSGRSIDVVFADGPFETVRDAALDHHIDLFHDLPVRVTVHRDGERTHLFVQQHHGIADGRAFIEFLGEWARVLEKTISGDSIERAEWLSRPESEAFDRTPGQLRATTRAGTRRHLAEWWHRRRRPLRKLKWNTDAASPGSVSTVHATMPAAVLGELRDLRDDWQAGVNSLLTAAYVLAARAQHVDAGWSASSPLACELVAETRPRDGSFHSFANHLSVLFLQLEDAELRELRVAARSIQKQVRAEVASDAVAQRALFRGWAARSLPIDELRKRVLDNVAMQTQMGFSNLTALPFPPMRGSGWRVTDVRVTTPTLPPHGVMLTAVRYGDEVTFNFNFCRSVVGEELVRDLAERFVKVLGSTGVSIDVGIEVSN